MLRVPPVVLITVHGEGRQWSGRGEESRGDPHCFVRVEEGGACSPALIQNDGAVCPELLWHFLSLLCYHPTLSYAP